MQEAKMKTILKLISALLYLNFVSVVSTYYLFDDKSSSGYASKMDGVAFANYGGLHKKRYTGNGTPKFMRGAVAHAVDYQFNLLKSPPYSFGGGAVQPWNGKNLKTQPNTRAPKKIERPNHEGNVVKPLNHLGNEEENQPTKDSLPKLNAKLSNRRPQVSPTNKIAQNDHYKKVQMKETQPASYEMYKTLEVNVNKKPIVSDPQKNVKNRLSSSMSINSFPNYYRRVHTAENMGMYKSEKFSDPNSPLLYKMLENMTNKLHEQKPKSYEYKKRETSGNIFQMYVVPRNVIRDDFKYTSKEIAKDHLKRADAFGGIEISMGANDKPYAVFYRMNPISLGEQEEVIMNNIDEFPGINKGKMNADVDIISLPRGNVKIHKKIKNYSSYKKY